MSVQLDEGFAALEAALAAAVPRRQTSDFRLDVVARSGLDVVIADAITSGDLERTTDGASTLSLSLADPHRELLRHPDLDRLIDLEYAGYWWRLVKVAKSGDDLTLTFEDRDVAYLRQHARFRKAKRAKITRAQFIRQLVREVGQDTPAQRKARRKGLGVRERRPIEFVCPELKRTQPLEGVPPRRTRTERGENREGGINRRADLTVKGARATAEQRRNGERVLDVADRLNAGPKATLALMEAVIVESLVRNLSTGHLDSLGILQVRVSTSGSSKRSRDIEWCCTQFLTRGFYNDPQLGGGGAIAIARRHPEASAGRVAQATQGSGVPGAYDQYAAEARKWLEAYGGASGTDTGGTATRGAAKARKKYEFRRGEPNKREDSWTCIQRLASEVNWHAFMDRGRLYYVSDDWLIKQKPRFVLDEDDDGIDTIDFDLDQGKLGSDITIQAHARLYQVPIGCVVQLRHCGVANGRYVVSSVRQSLFDNACEITARRQTPKLPEPLSEGGVSPGGPQGATPYTLPKGTDENSTLRDRIVAVAQASRSSYSRNPGSWYYAQGGRLAYSDPTRPPPRGTRSDCSQWVAAVYKRAGAPAPGPSYNVSIYTGNMKVRGRAVPLSQARPGDIIVGPSHVELYVGPGNRTIGHGSPPVDYGTTGLVSGAVCWRYGFLD